MREHGGDAGEIDSGCGREMSPGSAGSGGVRGKNGFRQRAAGRRAVALAAQPGNGFR